MKPILRPAVKADIPALCRIWEACFSDSRDYIEYFYRENFERIETLLIAVDEVPVSVVHMLPACLEGASVSQRAKFIYAVGTLPEHRSNGYMSKLISTITADAKQQGNALFLKPSSPTMTEFYARFGFEKGSSFRLVSLDATATQPLEAEEISAVEYNRMRDAAFSGAPYVRWDDAHIQWCIDENRYFSGKTLKIIIDGSEYFMMGYPEKDTLIINETDLPLSRMKLLSTAFCEMFGTKRIKAYLPSFSCKEGECVLSSVFYNAPSASAYVNLILI